MSPSEELRELFPAGDGPAQPVKVLRRHGHLQLALPEGRAALPALELYPAQRLLARLAKQALRWAVALGLPLPLAEAQLTLSEQDPFVRFLRGLASGTTGEFSLGVCAGNPRAEGRRWLVLVCAGATPLVVVKAGVSPSARALIARESSLEPAPAARTILARHEDERVSAFAMPFIAGTPVPPDLAFAWDLASRWLRADERTPLSTLPPWPAFASASLSSTERAALDRLGAVEVTPVFFHGDLAPWNIRHARAGSDPVVLDWERGESRGVPLWDVLHFLVQPLVLVQRAGVTEITAALEAVLDSEEARQYAVQCGFAGLERALAWAYLLHCVYGLRQTEGSSLLKTLLTHLTERWNVA